MSTTPQAQKPTSPDLNCLLLTRDGQLERVVRPALEDVNVKVELASESHVAEALLRLQHFDGFVVDCDDVPGANALVDAIRKGRSNSRSPIMAIVNGKTTSEMALQHGANFVLAKPVSRQRLESYLSIAMVFLNREFRRYFRYKVEIAAKVLSGTTELQATLVDVSKEGLGLTLAHPKKLEGSVEVRFTLRDIGNAAISAKVQVAWSNDAGRIGSRIMSMPEASVRSFNQWLAVLESRGD